MVPASESGRNARKVTKKTTVSLAIDSNVLSSIKEEAKSQGTSLNSRINSILEKYVSFYKHTEELEPCIIAYNQFAKMLDLMDEEKLTEIIAIDGVAHALSALEHNRVPATMDMLIEYLFKTGIRYTGAYSSFHYYLNEDRQLCLVFGHKFGLKWSKIIATAISRIIELTLEYPLERKVLPYTVELKVLQKDIPCFTG